ncbi:Uncharacterised protein [uncultured Clostridium sp.]|nr:Uncharacterised protein [uncultured Clostridium sp.]
MKQAKGFPALGTVFQFQRVAKLHQHIKNQFLFLIGQSTHRLLYGIKQGGEVIADCLDKFWIIPLSWRDYFII